MRGEGIMSSANKLRQACQKIIDNCIGCSHCVAECQLLQRINEDPISIARREPSVEEAYACTLCMLCETVCPASLSPKKMFAETRVKAVDSNYIDINDYRYMFPDRKINVMSLYRELNGIAYDDLGADQQAPVAFFPGCTMLTYDPELIRSLFVHLNKEYRELTLITDCCGLPLYQLGLQGRGDDYVRGVKDKLMNLKVKSLIIACPNCYYQLRPVLEGTGVNLLTIYEALNLSKLFNNTSKNNGKQRVTVHDSCPDRCDGIFASQVRGALAQKGFDLVEMQHNRKLTVCCGSGGQISHFQPDLAAELVEYRLNEAKNSGAQVLAAYCLACVLNFAKKPGQIKTQHVLNLLLEVEQDFAGLKTKAKMMFAGPEGEERWARIMAED